MRPAPESVEQRFERALEDAERFFMKTGKVHQAALAIAQRLDAAGIPYAVDWAHGTIRDRLRIRHEAMAASDSWADRAAAVAYLPGLAVFSLIER